MGIKFKYLTEIKNLTTLPLNTVPYYIFSTLHVTGNKVYSVNVSGPKTAKLGIIFSVGYSEELYVRWKEYLNNFHARLD